MPTTLTIKAASHHSLADQRSDALGLLPGTATWRSLMLVDVLEKTFAESEVKEDSVIRKFRITAADGKIDNTQHYFL